MLLLALVVTTAAMEEDHPIMDEGGEDTPNENYVSDEGEDTTPIEVAFVNEFPDKTIELYWEDPEAEEEDGRKFEGSIPPRGNLLVVNTFPDHEFSYDLDGMRHYLRPGLEQHVVLAGDTDGFLVRCDIKLNSSYDDISSLDLLVKPYWAPRGASRFLTLVRSGYYDGVALNRVVPQFLIQFGIARDVELRKAWSEETMPDDVAFDDMKFEPGFVSYAGYGPDSRTTEIFIVMPGTSWEQLDYFGTDSWETPFAVVQGNLTILTEIYSGYGDMPPEGAGPDPSRVYDKDGYEYLAEHYPKLDYIDRCYVVNEQTGLLSPEL